MENSNLQQYLSKQLFTGGASIITKRTLNEIMKLNREFDGSIQWRDQIIAITDTIHELGHGLSVIEAVLLAIIEDRWKDFDQDWRDQFNDDFEVMVFRRYGRKPGTIRADLRAVRIFLLNEKPVKPFGSLDLPKRGITGDVLTDDSGKCVTERIEWDPTKTTLAKLKVAVPIAEQGKMTEQVWQMMADEHVSSSQMVKTIFRDSYDDPHPPQLTIRFRMEGPVLVAYENGNEISLGELDWSGYYEDPYSLKHRAMDKVLAALGLTLDEHVTLYKEAEEQHNGYYHGSENFASTGEE